MKPKKPLSELKAEHSALTAEMAGVWQHRESAVLYTVVKVGLFCSKGPYDREETVRYVCRTDPDGPEFYRPLDEFRANFIQIFPANTTGNAMEAWSSDVE